MLPVIQVRKAWQHGIVVIECKSRSSRRGLQPELAGYSHSAKYEIYFNGEAWRVDATLPDLVIGLPDGTELATDAGGRPWQRRVFRRPGEYGSRLVGEYPQGFAGTVESGVSASDNLVDRLIVDPRVLGLVPVQHSQLVGLSLSKLTNGPPFVIDAPELSPETARLHRVIGRRDISNGVATVHNEIEYIISDEFPGEVASVIMTVSPTPPRREKVVCRVDSKLLQWPSGVVYPSQLRFSTTSNDVLIKEEIIGILSIDVEQSVPEELFSLKGLGIAIGEGVNVRSNVEPALQYGRWTGDSVDLQFGAPAAESAVATYPVQTPSNSWRILVIIGNVAVGLGLIAWSWLRRRSRLPPSKTQN